jgi:hypothetical protein
MKTGKEYLESLHPVEQANWEEAFKSDLRNARISNHRQYILEKSYESLRHFIASSFKWSWTIQGVEYWDLLSKK